MASYPGHQPHRFSMIDSITRPINIKGIREGLLVSVDDRLPYDEMRHLLEAELAEKESFLQGSQITLQTGSRPLRASQLLQIQKLFLRHDLALRAILSDEATTRAAARDMGFATRLAGSHTDLDGNLLAKKAPETAAPPPGSDHLPGGLVLKETLRSGRRVFHEGDVVVIGDVNPGAELIAGGDVIVWGRLRGLVHAGALGDETAVICALDLSPTQLRIAGQIAIAPAEKEKTPKPETAVIRDGQIVAEAWRK